MSMIASIMHDVIRPKVRDLVTILVSLLALVWRLAGWVRVGASRCQVGVLSPRFAGFSEASVTAILRG
jgi:hypothetical protein